MELFDIIFPDDSLDQASDVTSGIQVNSASGLPMLDGMFVDIAGNPLGSDFSSDMDLCGLGDSSDFGSHINLSSSDDDFR